MKLFNTLTRKKEIFRPLRKSWGGLYACGPTVYNFAHIGNLRTYIFEDIMRRALEMAGFKIRLVMNITDVEDKIIKEAKKSGKSISEFVKPYESAFFGDLKLLNIKPAFKYPKATAHIKDMVTLIQNLLKKDLAYESDGSIYFNISRFKKYGRLSGVKKRELKTGARVDSDEYAKEDAQDFVLWKAAKPDEPSWVAKFQLGGGVAKLVGRPGWHIECSAMSMKYLGPILDIHSGAVDLIFPHHENEIAQSEGATGKKFSRFFVEGEHLLVDGQKMSKSIGNFYTLRDIKQRGFDPLVFRYLVLTSHYRSKLNFTWESLTAAQNVLEKIKNRVIELKSPPSSHPPLSSSLRPLIPLRPLFRREFQKAIFNDLDTPKALAVFWKNFGRLSLGDILWADRIFGLNLSILKPLNPPDRIKKLVQGREKARKVKDWKTADSIRNKIQKSGWQVEDSPNGPVIKLF